MSRLTIDIKEYAIERLFPSAGDDERAMAELRTLLEQRMGEGARGEVLAQTLTEITDESMNDGGHV